MSTFKEKITLALEQEKLKALPIAAALNLEKIYNEKRSSITVTYNGNNYSWTKPRHWEDWQGVMILGNGINHWIDDSGTPRDLTNVDCIAISNLIFDKKQQLFMAKVLDELDITNGIYTLINITTI